MRLAHALTHAHMQSPQTNRLFQLMYAEQSAPVLKEEQTESYLSSVVKLPALTPIRKRVLGILKNGAPFCLACRAARCRAFFSPLPRVRMAC